MKDIYAPCPCRSGKKLKFCCYKALKSGGTLLSGFEYCKFPIYNCKVLKNWDENGVSPVYVVRELYQDSYVFASYLVDFWCLGVKDVTFKVGVSERALKDYCRRSDYELISISYQDARSLILGAVDFARVIGISPHVSWEGAPSSFIESHLDYEKKYQFGDKGEYHYFSGPRDHELYDIDEVVAKVDATGGHFTIYSGVSSSPI